MFSHQPVGSGANCGRTVCCLHASKSEKMPNSQRPPGGSTKRNPMGKHTKTAVNQSAEQPPKAGGVGVGLVATTGKSPLTFSLFFLAFGKGFG